MVKTLVITGGAGFLGSYLCERGVAEGYRVVCFDNLITGREENLNSLGKESKFYFEERDVCEGIKLEGEVSFVFHLASPASPVDYLKFPIETMKTGSIGTINVLEFAREKKAVFVLASTSEVYGDPEVSPQPETYWGNVNPIGSRSVYDESKRFSEAVTMAYHRKYGLDVRIARIFNTYGPRMKEGDGRVIPSFILACLRNKAIPIFGNGRQTRSFCYVDDLIEGLWRLSMMNVKERVINLGGEQEIEIIELARIIQNICKVDSGYEFLPLPEDDPKRRKPDTTLARKLLNWQPRISLEEGIEKTLNYFKGVIKFRKGGGEND